MHTILETHPRNLAAAFIGLVAVIAALPTSATALEVPSTINHQGYVTVDGTPFTGTGAFRFAFVNSQGTNIWTNDGSQLYTENMPDTALEIPVNNGFYSWSLGASNHISDGVLTEVSNLELLVWFDDGVNGPQQLGPPQPLQSVPYARVAGTLQSFPDEITVEQVNYGTPRTKYLILRGPDFISYPQVSNAHAEGAMNGDGVDPDVRFHAPVHLPGGAELVEMTLWFDDQDPDSEVQAQLTATDIPNNIYFCAGDVDTGGVTGEGSNSSTDVTEAPVDNSIYHYQLELSDTSRDWDDCEIRGVRLEYTISETL